MNHLSTMFSVILLTLAITLLIVWKALIILTTKYIASVRMLRPHSTNLEKTIWIILFKTSLNESPNPTDRLFARDRKTTLVGRGERLRKDYTR